MNVEHNDPMSCPCGEAIDMTADDHVVSVTGQRYHVAHMFRHATVPPLHDVSAGMSITALAARVKEAAYDINNAEEHQYMRVSDPTYIRSHLTAFADGDNVWIHRFMVQVINHSEEVFWDGEGDAMNTFPIAGEVSVETYVCHINQNGGFVFGTTSAMELIARHRI